MKGVIFSHFSADSNESSQPKGFFELVQESHVDKLVGRLSP